MKKENYTAIKQFIVIKPTNKYETVGEEIDLSRFGEFCPDKSLRGYTLLFLLDHPDHYRVSKIVMKGITYNIPQDREKNWITKIMRRNA